MLIRIRKVRTPKLAKTVGEKFSADIISLEVLRHSGEYWRPKNVKAYKSVVNLNVTEIEIICKLHLMIDYTQFTQEYCKKKN